MVEDVRTNRQSPDERSRQSLRGVVDVHVVELKERLEEMTNKSSLFSVSEKLWKNSLTIPVVGLDKPGQVLVSFLLIEVRVICYPLADDAVQGLLELWVLLQLLSDSVNVLKCEVIPSFMQLCIEILENVSFL